jgi:hypothetical protein
MTQMPTNPKDNSAESEKARQEAIDMYKSQLDDLRREYDRHSAHGSQPDKENQCVREIRRISADLKERYGVEY